MSRELESLRVKIDDADRALIEVLRTRMKIVDEVGLFKRAHNIEALDPERLSEILATRAAWAGRDLSPEFVNELFELVHRYSVAREQQKKI